MKAKEVVPLITVGPSLSRMLPDHFRWNRALTWESTCSRADATVNKCPLDYSQLYYCYFNSLSFFQTTMPSLADTLDQLRSLSGQISQLSRCNCRPSGPYTSAYLASNVVPDLIRDGSEAEKRLFKFIGESDSSIKRVEKREGLVTPLKDLKAGKVKGSQSEIDVVLRAVGRLVDD